MEVNMYYKSICGICTWYKKADWVMNLIQLSLSHLQAQQFGICISVRTLTKQQKLLITVGVIGPNLKQQAFYTVHDMKHESRIDIAQIVRKIMKTS